VASRRNLVEKIAAIVRGLRPPSAWTVGAAVASSLAYSAMLRPSRYWLIDQIPFLELGASRFEPDFQVARLSAYQIRLATRIFSRLDSYNAIRRYHADQLRSGLEGIEGVEIPRPVDGTNPVYLRFPILTRDRAHRAYLLGRLRQAGISAHPSYPTSIADIPGIGSYLAQGQEACPAARDIAARVLTLPTHPGVTSHDVESMVKAFEETRRERETAR
jgi:perosamine synthetase